MGFVDRCTISEPMWQAVSRNLEPRQKWVNEHVLLDEILPLRNPGLLVRTIAKGQPRWDLIELLPDQRFKRSPIPIASASGAARMSGDVRNGRVVLLVAEEEPEASGVHPRLLVGTIRP
jgi:hypothetical protein